MITREMGLIGGGVFALLYPFEVMKTKAQAELHTSSMRQIAKKIYTSQGLKGFYTGFGPSGLACCFKQLYRYPLLEALPPMLRNILPLSLQQNCPDIVPLSTALLMAHFEIALTPLERCKVILITSEPGKNRLLNFFGERQAHLITELFRGSDIVYMRQFVSWSSFLVAGRRLMQWEAERTQSDSLSFSSLLRITCLVGLINTAVTMPFDVTKTAVQKKEPLSSERDFFKTLNKIYLTHGVKGLYAGWQFRIPQYMLRSLFTMIGFGLVNEHE